MRQRSLFDEPARHVTKTLEEIRAELGDCGRCQLSERRTNIVFGQGDPHAEVMFVGEGPGQTEDERGLPFVGKSGIFFDLLVREELRLTRDKIYVTNVVKCRPPGNRDPQQIEIDTCRPFLEAQIDSVRPRVLVPVGKYAAQTILRSSAPISKLRGQTRVYHRQDRNILVVPTFHPAYVLRSPKEEWYLRLDLKLVRRHLTGDPLR